jgi:hypothetical protein
MPRVRPFSTALACMMALLAGMSARVSIADERDPCQLALNPPGSEVSLRRVFSGSGPQTSSYYANQDEWWKRLQSIYNGSRSWCEHELATRCAGLKCSDARCEVLEHEIEERSGLPLMSFPYHGSYRERVTLGPEEDNRYRCDAAQKCLAGPGEVPGGAAAWNQVRAVRDRTCWK